MVMQAMQVLRKDAFFPAFAEEHAVVCDTQITTEANQLLGRNSAKLIECGHAKHRHDSRKVPARGGNIRDVVVQHGALHNSAVEERSRGIVDGEKVEDDVRSTSRLAKERNIGRVSPESADEAMDPLERTDLIAQTVIANALVAS
jgi:hypothetical protein